MPDPSEIEYEKIPPSDVLGWKELLDKITDCSAGVVMKNGNIPLYDQYKGKIADLETASKNTNEELIRFGGENQDQFI
jgi:hypothetical protein